MAYLPSPTTPIPTRNTKPLPKPIPLPPHINQTRHPTLKVSLQTSHEPKANPQRRDLLLGLATLCGTPLLSAPPAPAQATPFPQVLDKVVRTRVARPAKHRSQREKDEEEEVLVISLEQLREDELVKFDVYVNDEYEFESKNGGVTRVTKEYAGSYVSLPSPRRRVEGRKSTALLKLALTQLIDDIGADGDDYIDVVLVPKAGIGDLVVNNVEIEFLA